jgi:aminomethyltransferase
MLKKTPLYTAHQQLGARLVEFGGWEMPLYYTSIIDEHQAVRSAAGIFDISHMGEISIGGEGALEFLNGVLTNDARKLQPGQGQYTLMCNLQGGVIDDLYLYQRNPADYLMVVNASRIQADFAWLEELWRNHPGRDSLQLRNQSDELAAVAVQGPKTCQFIDKCFPVAAQWPSALRKNEMIELMISGRPVLVSRTGYTGEDGFEVVAPAEQIGAIWSKILEVGGPFGTKPAGLGARDTLRTEACYPLYGHELDEETTPLEAGQGFFVVLGKGDFIGRAVLAEQKAKGVSKKMVAFKMAGRSAPPRPRYPIWSASKGTAPIGQVTSGTQSPTLGVGIGLGFVAPEFSPANTSIGIEIRGKQAPAIIAPRPLYRSTASGIAGQGA